jgi:ribosomal protein S1
MDRLVRRYPANTRLFGKVTNLTDYGAFVEVEQGIEGLVHVSEMDWTNKTLHQTKLFNWATKLKLWFWKSTKNVVVSAWA